MCNPLGNVWICWCTQSPNQDLGGHGSLPVMHQHMEVVGGLSQRIEDGLLQGAGSEEERPLYDIHYGWSKALKEVGNIKRLDRFEMSLL